MDQYIHPLHTPFKQLCKEIIWLFFYNYKPNLNKKPIFLYASRRSGSTYLMELIYANKGITFSDQPFGLYSATSANINKLPIFEYSQIVNPDESEKKILKEYIYNIINGNYPVNAPWNILESSYSLFSDRIVCKITDAKCLIEWFSENYTIDTVVMTRHPVSQALSVGRNNWLYTGQGFIRNRSYVEEYLTKDQVSFCNNIYFKGTDIEKRVLDWSLENIPLIKKLQDHPEWHYISYENLVNDPVNVINQFSTCIKLMDLKKMKKKINKPSKSTKKSSTIHTKKLIRGGETSSMLYNWLNKLSEKEIDQCFNVLKYLEIDLYNKKSIFPDKSTINR